MNDFIVDIFRYFAKFPNIDGVKKNIINKKSKLVDYSTIQAQIENMPIHSLVPEISSFLFGISEDIIQRSIQSVPGVFLFVEYGQILRMKDKYSIIENNLNLAFSVAQHFSWENKDSIEETILMNNLLKIVYQILNIIESENKTTCNFLDLLSFPMQILPIEPKAFYGCIGWTVLTKRKESN